MKNIILVQTQDIIVNRYLPLAISNVWLYAQTFKQIEQQYRVADVVIDKVDPDVYFNKINFKPDVVAFSVYVWNWKHTVEMSKTVKKRFPDCKIIVGGPSIPKYDHAFFKKNPYFDIAVLGEGELAFKTILSNNLEPISIPNVFYKGHSLPKLIARTHDLDAIPSGMETGFYKFIMDKYNKFYPNTRWALAYETMRGCPYHCSFCDIGDSYHNKVKFFNIDKIYKDIDWMSLNGIEYVNVVDSNWGMFERDLDITKYVIHNKLKYGFPQHWDVSFAKNNYNRIFNIALENKLAKTNLFKGITFAYQSTDSDVLKAIDRFNLDPIKSQELLSRFRNEEISTYSELVFPLPNDTKNTLKKSIQDLIDWGQRDFLQIHMTTMQPNAPINSRQTRKKYGLKTKFLNMAVWGLDESNLNRWFDRQEVIIETNTLTKKEHIESYLFSWIVISLYYYGWGHYIIEYLNKKFNIKHTDLMQNLLDYSKKEKNNLLYEEYVYLKKHFIKILKNEKSWGRKILPNCSKYFDPKAASSIVYYQNKKKYFSFIYKWLINNLDVTKEEAKEIIEFNDCVFFDYKKKYPFEKHFSKQLVNTLFSNDENKFIFDHYDANNIFDLNEYCLKAFHWQRKNKYWHCSIKKSQ